MRLTLIGTGNAGGIPLYGCDCTHCTLAKSFPESRRGPTCAFLEVEGKKYLIDAGIMNIVEIFTGFDIDGIFLTHFHPDHVQGLFHLRWGKGRKIPVYCPPDTIGCADLFKHPGILDFQSKKKFTSFEDGALKIVPLPLIHSKVTFGYLFEFNNKTIAYLTDTKGIPPNTLDYLKQYSLEIVIIDTSFPPGVEGKGHNNLDDTLAIIAQLNVNTTYLTHIGHDFHVWLSTFGNTLPASVVVAHDGLSVSPFETK